jgi:hypothetical protein
MTLTQPLRLVAFDLDGVLCDFHPARRLAYLADLTGEEPGRIQAAIWDSEFERNAEAGAYPTGDAYLREFNRRLGFPLARAQWVESRQRAMAASGFMSPRTSGRASRIRWPSAAWYCTTGTSHPPSSSSMTVPPVSQARGPLVSRRSCSRVSTK